MSLLDVQTFIAAYIRDQKLRERIRSAGGIERAELGMPLSDEDEKLIGELNFDMLEKRAEDILDERRGRTEGVFGPFIEHLARFVDVAEHYREFDRQWQTGWWQRRNEIRRFEAFAFDLVMANGLPEYLVDLCRVCAAATLIADTPKVLPDWAESERPVHGSDTVSLREPHEVLSLRHDVLRIIAEEDGYAEAPFPVPTRILVQRDWAQHKRSHLHPLRGEPILEALTDGPVTVFELGGRLPEIPYDTLRPAVAGLWREQLIHLRPVPEL